MKNGAGDYTRTRDGKLSLVRRLLPDGTTQVTRLGRLFFKSGRTEYVASVPVVVAGQNARGRVQSRATKLPVDMLGVGQLLQDSPLPEQSRIDRVKSHVLEKLAIRTSGGRTVLMEISGETFSYDREGSWLISALTTFTQGDEAVTSALMRQPLGAGPVTCASFLPYSDCIADCAFETHDDLHCVPMQLANCLCVSLGEVISYFDDFLELGWQGRGVTALELKELCRRQGRSF